MVCAGALARTKTILGSGANGDADGVSDLYELANLAEQFLAKRHTADKEWLARVLDTLDREGTSFGSSARARLVNALKLVNIGETVRLSGYRLIEAGTPSKPGIEGVHVALVSGDLIHLLQLASKAGAALAEIGKADIASKVLTSAAQYEESLRKAEDPQQMHQQARAQATVVYQCCRMEAAWQGENDGLAEYMLQRITGQWHLSSHPFYRPLKTLAADDNEHLMHITAHDREMLASKFLELGRSLLSNDHRKERPIEERAQEAVTWIQKAFVLADQLEEVSATTGLKVRAGSVRFARAYVLSATKHPEHLVRAETSLKEVLAPTEITDKVNGEFQELRWWMLAILKRRDAADDELREVFESIIDHMVFSEENVTRIVQEVRTLSRRPHHLMVSVLQRCLHRNLESTDDAALACVDQILLALILQCSKSQDHATAIACLRDAFHRGFSAFHDSDFHLSKTGATACLMLFWQFAHQHFRAKRYQEAAEWYLLGTHSAFRGIADLCHDKCCRKAALCHIEMHDYSHATLVAQQCATDSALTQYILLLIATRQGVEEEAMRAVRAMVKAADYDRKMLLMATRLAHEADLKALLLSVLEELLNSVQRDEDLRSETEGVTLIRCTIRLVVRLMADPAVADKNTLVDTLIGHFRTGAFPFAPRDMVQAGCAQKRLPLIIKDVSWLWRTAYNCANQGCAEWENAEEKVPALFDVAGELISAYCQVVVQVEEEVHLAAVLASFAATSARVFLARRFVNEQMQMLQEVAQSVSNSEGVIRNVLEKAILKADNAATALQCLRAILVFKVEVAVLAKAWGKIPEIIESIVGLPTDSVDTLEAVTDMLWAERDCPLAGIILHVSLDNQMLSVDKFSRWLRAICTMLLSRSTTPDRLKAVAYIEQAVAVLNDHADDRDERGEIYPLDERYWLLTTSYNTGIECLHVGLLDEAKRWFEVSSIFCRFVPDGETSSQKVCCDAEVYYVLAPTPLRSRTRTRYSLTGTRAEWRPSAGYRHAAPCLPTLVSGHPSAGPCSHLSGRSPGLHLGLVVLVSFAARVYVLCSRLAVLGFTCFLSLSLFTIRYDVI
ncbi:meiosis protein SPO22/ZIP4 like-domain-containing protein [Vararia minispora EC-137]|uniref:Meiosis protein SPO22/ZIP4 like-domain-containing protein n=1 Tax=Vararia minispora EC-137 TaxID=1314806 RepID=A0ACB8QPX0_9AGAM|nr:meiosis protein SPO22/ZIP4 like-domain-containing protein [Vararia minispora EC-137]